MKRRTVAVALTLVAISACGGSHGHAPSNPASSPTRTNDLTGIGATRAGFRETHTADPDPQHVPDCCFLPKVSNAGSSDQDQFGPVMFGGGHVVNETINFATGTPRAVAINAIHQELPPDARRVSFASTRECQTLIYESQDLLASDGPPGYVSASLYGKFNGPYNSDDIESVIMMIQGRQNIPC